MLKSRKNRVAGLLILSIALSLLLSGCSLGKSTPETAWLVVATSQEMLDSGVTEAVTAEFEATYHARIKWLAVSSCTALNYISQDSRIDVLLVSSGAELERSLEPNHDFCKTTASPLLTNSNNGLAPAAPTLPPFDAPYLTATPVGTFNAVLPTPTALDVKYLLAERQTIFWEPLVLVGPPNDPLHLANTATISKAFKTIAEQQASFLVAGQEPSLLDLEEVWWNQVGYSDRAARGKNYQIFDGTYPATLALADKNKAYTVVPLNVFLTSHQSDKSEIIFSKDVSMFLPYETLIHNSTRCGDCDLLLARQFVNYLLESPTQAKILSLGKSSFKQAFFLQPDYRVYRPR